MRRWSLIIMSVVMPMLMLQTAFAARPYFVPFPGIFRLKIGGCNYNPKERGQTGFLAKDLGMIVTALHGIADCTIINAVNDEGKSITNLNIQAVDIDRDIAGLSSNDLMSYRGKGFDVITSDNFQTKDLKIIGYPKGNDVQLATYDVRVELYKMLDNIIPNNFVTLEQRKRNSPNLKFEALKVQEHLLPGHSGAPLLDNNNKVIGVADGGLEGGAAEINWAFFWGDFNWSSATSSEVKSRLDKLKQSKPELALGFSSTFPDSFDVTAESSSTGAPTSTPGAKQNVNGVNFIYVPSGYFIMGSTDAQVYAAFKNCQKFTKDCKLGWFQDEINSAQVSQYIDGFWMMQTEVTNAQYEKFIQAGGYNQQEYWTEDGWAWRTEKNVQEPRSKYWRDGRYHSATQPVVAVTWYEALAFTKWFAEMTGAPVRLPTEAEWEKAARGEDGRIYPWGDKWDGRLANYCDVNCPEEDRLDPAYNDGYRFTSPVGSYPPGASPYGLLDMAGNVWEWTSSLHDFSNYPYQQDKVHEDLYSPGERTVRGGAFDIRSDSARTANRRGDDPDTQDVSIGFRLAMDATAGP